MGKGTIGQSHTDRAADKMDKFMSKNKTKAPKMRTLLEQFQDMYPNTWRQELEKTRNEPKPWDANFKKKGPWTSEK